MTNPTRVMMMMRLTANQQALSLSYYIISYHIMSAVNCGPEDDGLDRLDGWMSQVWDGRSIAHETDRDRQKRPRQASGWMDGFAHHTRGGHE